MTSTTSLRSRPTNTSNSPGDQALDRVARWLIWASPAWAVLLFLGTISHQPPPQTDFPGYARYITTTEFLASHIVASIAGAAIGNLGFVGIFIALIRRGAGSLGVWALVTAVLGNTVITSIFGAAAFAQPAIGRMYLAGQTTQAMALQDDIYGVPLAATAFPAVLLLAIGLVLFGVAVARSRSLPRWAGILLAISGPLFAIVGVALADVVQSIGAVGLIASTAWIARSAQRPEAVSPPARG
jgi:hypothetical protein